MIEVTINRKFYRRGLPLLPLLLLSLIACGDADGTDTSSTTSQSSEDDATNPVDPSESGNDGDGSCIEGDSAPWGATRCEPAETFFASDLSQAVQDGVTQGLMHAASVWGNYGPLEYWVMGTDNDAGLALIENFCTRRDARGDWDKFSCIEHHTREDGEHNLLSYLKVGQEVIANNQPMGTAGRNGRRDWGIHLFASSYPFAFDRLFDIPPEEETKTVFHEYFHAVQHAFIESLDYQRREELLGPTWFVEGGAEYMAQSYSEKLLNDGTITRSGMSYPSFRERMEWKMVSGKETLDRECTGMSIADITYADPCSYSAYELGAWGHAYLQHLAGEQALLEVFYPYLNELGWESAFERAFGMTSEIFYIQFETFLERPLSEQLAILPSP